MKQIRYYNGEESSHDIGIGVAPFNIHNNKNEIRKNAKKYELMEGLYLQDSVIIKIHKENTPFSGNLEIKLIGETSKQLQKVAQNHNLPFSEKAVVEYYPDEILFF
jgi:hypothetical protein